MARHHGPPAPGPETGANFIRGFVATGLLSAIHSGGKGELAGKAVLRDALRGGTALAAGSASAHALQRRDYGSLLVAVAAGAAGLVAIEGVMNAASVAGSKEEDHG